MDFLNELGKKLASRSERGRDDDASERLSAQLREAREELEARLADLGRAYYESVAGTSQDVPPGLVSRAREAMERVARLSERRERETRRVRCPSCGAMQPESSRFCANCGRRMPEPPPEADPPEAPEAAYCPNCGAMRQGGERYCALCGATFLPDGAPESDPPLPAPRKPEEPPEEPGEDRETWQ